MRERSEMEENNGGKCFPAGWRAVAAKPCDSCGTAPALLFCRFDKAFMCLGCDAKVHAPPSRHERVWMCEVCEMAPASVTCKADAAALCVACDRDIHSANPLARRHERIPVVPFYGAAAESVAKSDCDAAADGEVPPEATWILSNPNPPKLPADNPDTKLIEFLLSDSDHFLDFDFPIPTDNRLQNNNHNSATDGVVPVQTAKPIPPPQITHHSPENRFEIDFTRSNLNSFNSIHSAQSLSHSVSSSSMDVGIVPDGSSMSDISYPFGLQLNSNFDPSNSRTANQGSQLSSSDRKARVMRYREKRKNRKFEKTIRYASRKAYAETRPRIKGRFAKRTETDAQVDEDRWFHGYGVVPSF